MEDGTDGKILEFLSVEMDLARVRDGMRIRLIRFDSLIPVRPSALEDLVTPIRGDMKGTVMKVKAYDDLKCAVRIPGKRLRKHELDSTCSTADLVQIFPVLH